MGAASPEPRHDDGRIADRPQARDGDGAHPRSARATGDVPQAQQGGAGPGREAIPGQRPSSRALVRLAVVLLILGAAAGVWEVLASQPPQTAFRLGVLAGPIAQLRRTAILLSLSLFAGAWMLPWAAPDREPRVLVGAVYVGSTLTIAAMIYGAATGMMGLQILDPRWDAQALFAVRAAGQGILGLCLLDFARRVLFRRPG